MSLFLLSFAGIPLTAGFIANNLLQWCFYYPAVLDPADLAFAPEEQKILGNSLQAYHRGDIRRRLDRGARVRASRLVMVMMLSPMTRNGNRPLFRNRVADDFEQALEAARAQAGELMARTG